MGKVFISHSTDDFKIAQRLSSSLKEHGHQVWISKQILPAQDIVGDVEDAIENADFVVVIWSAAAQRSAWVRRELSSRLMNDLQINAKTIIPVLIDETPIPYLFRSIRWVDFRRSYDDGLSQLLNLSTLGKMPESRLGTVFELCYLFLLLDQFASGVWGVSLEEDADLYGHKGDPGSISISTFSSLALYRFTGKRSHSSIFRYRSYLQQRQSKNGAFGMLREIGTLKYPRSEILEHGRHTATALSYFLTFDGPSLPAARLALNYLLMNRTSKGLWVDIGPFVDDNVDPITVALIVNTLEQFQDSLVDSDSSSEDIKNLLPSINEAIETGIHYIFNCPLRTDEGYWHYKLKGNIERERVFQNLYVYTTDVLSSIILSCRRAGQYLDEINRLVGMLFRIARDHDGGLPPSQLSHIPDLDATSRLIETARVLDYWTGEAEILFRGLVEIALEETIIHKASANGWSAFLLLYGTPDAPFRPWDLSRLQLLDNLVENLLSSKVEDIQVPDEMSKHEKFILNTIAKR